MSRTVYYHTAVRSEQASSQLKAGFPTHATTALCRTRKQTLPRTHGGDTHGVVLPHHNTPGPVRAATLQQRGSCIIASVGAGGTGGVSTRAHPSIMARPAAGRHHGAHATPHPQARAHAISVRVAWPTPRAAAAGAPGGPRAHSARNAHTARQRSPPAPPAHMVHMSCRRRACGPRWSPRDARLGCCSTRASTRQRQVR